MRRFNDSSGQGDIEWSIFVFMLFILGFAILICALLALFREDDRPSISELDAKAYLVEKYNPGLCFGMPHGVSEYEISTTIDRNPDLVEFVKERFGAERNYDIYVKITQLNQIYLTKTDSGYNFILTDGHCCRITTYKGKITIKNGELHHEVTEESTKTVPC